MPVAVVEVVVLVLVQSRCKANRVVWWPSVASDDHARSASVSLDRLGLGDTSVCYILIGKLMGAHV